MARSIHHKLERVRTPRVSITYDVEIGGTVQWRELPFVIGVLGDFVGVRESPSPLRDRSFVSIDWDNFDDVLAAMKPRVACEVPDGSGGTVQVELTFSSMADFEPQSLVQRIEPLRALHASTALETLEALRYAVDAVLHAPAFQRLEASWRGLWYLVSRTETGSQLKIKVIDVSKTELERHLERASELDQSIVFRKLYEEPFGQYGGEPFGLVIADYAFSSAPRDVALLQSLAGIAGACFAPLVASAAPEMFGLDSFARLPEVRDLARVFQAPEYAAWRTFRESDDARFVALTVPRVLGRAPYAVRPGESAESQHEESTSDECHLLWGSAAYAFGACVARAFARYGWCGAIRGLEGGGLVEGLPTWVHEVKGEGFMRSGVEVTLHDRREKELTDLGFLPLLQFVGTDRAVFFATQSCAKFRLYDNDAATVTSRLSCQLQYVLTTSRFMHYLKAIARDRVGSYHERGDLERQLNRWISQYVLLDDQASPAVRVQRPLGEARIDVAEHPGKPGIYRAVAFLRPHLQLDELAGSLRLVTDLR